MNLTELLQNDLPIFTPGQTIGELHDFFAENNLTHIGICETSGLFLGLVSAASIKDLSKEIVVSKAEQLLQFDAVFVEDHFPTHLRFLKKNQSNIIPVLNSERQFLGYITSLDIVHKLEALPVFHNDNDTLILSKASEDFSLAEIVQIAVSNQAIINGAFIVEKTEVDTVVVIQLQTEKIQSCLDEMRRFGYDILETSFEDLHVENLKVNAEYLNRYLNV